MSKPIELIVANTMHGVAETLRKLPEGSHINASKRNIAEAAARSLLCTISHEGSLAAVLAALAAAGAPGALSEIQQRLAAAGDVIRDLDEAKTAEAPPCP